MRHCALRRCVIIITIFLALLATGYTRSNPPTPSPSEIQKPEQQKSESARKPTEPDKNGPKTTPFIVKEAPSEAAKPKPSERSDEGGDEPSADWWMVKLTAVLAFIGVWQLVIFGLQARRLKQTIEAMKKIGADQSRDMQASITVAKVSSDAAIESNRLISDLFIAENRPWVRPQVINADPIVITEQKLSLGITLQFINTGTSPACNVDYSFDFVTLDYPRLSIRQDDMCKMAEMFSAQTDEKIQRYFTIFPNETGNMIFHLPIETSDVDKFNVLAGALNDPNPIFWIAPILIGCVAYRWDGNPKYHHTMFSYDFGVASPDGTFMRIISGPKVIDATNVRVQPGAIARNTAD